MKLNMIVPTVALIVLSVVAVGAKKAPPAPHLFVYDLKTQNFVPLVAPDGAQIYVVGPSGIQPGVFAGKSDDGKAILILPPEIMDQDQPEPPGPPTAQPQKDNERLDHANLVKISK